jgi:hypothetical protein
MHDRLRKVDDFFYVDDEDHAYFCIRDFLRLHSLPDNPAFRHVLIEELEAVFQGVRILEEWN